MLQVKARQLFALVLEHGALLTLSNPPGPPLTFRSSQHLHYDYQSLLAWTPTDCNPPVSPQPQVFPTDPASAAPVPALTSLKSWLSLTSPKYQPERPVGQWLVQSLLVLAGQPWVHPSASQTQQVTTQLLPLPFSYSKTWLFLPFLSKKQFKYIHIYVF